MGGWTTGIGAATDLAALLVGVYDDGVLRYAGKIGTGFTGTKRAELLSSVALASERRNTVYAAASASAHRRAECSVGASGARHTRRVRQLDH